MSPILTRALRPRKILAGVAIATLLGMSPAAAETYTFLATLNGHNEVPPNDSKGTGTLTATYDTTTKKLSWKVTYSNLSGPPFAAHFHGPAGPGKNAPVEVPVTTGPSPMQGSARLTQPQENNLLDGDLYFNLHTHAHPAGEIRGQVNQAVPG